MPWVCCCTAVSKVMFKSTVHTSLILYWWIIQQFEFYLVQAGACDHIPCYPFILDFIIFDLIYKNPNQPWRNWRSDTGLGYILVHLLWRWSRFIMREIHPVRFNTEYIWVFWQVEVNHIYCFEVKELMRVVAVLLRHWIRSRKTEAGWFSWLTNKTSGMPQRAVPSCTFIMPKLVNWLSNYLIFGIRICASHGTCFSGIAGEETSDSVSNWLDDHGAV